MNKDFPVGSLIIPTDSANQSQAGLLQIHGFVYACVSAGVPVYRLLQKDSDSTIIKTDSWPAGRVHKGGPFFITVVDAYGITPAILAAFPNVIYDVLYGESFSSSTFTDKLTAARIAIIEVNFHAGSALTTMGIPYDGYTPLQVKLEPFLLEPYDVILVDCGGIYLYLAGFGYAYDDVYRQLADLLIRGRCITFIHGALLDLNWILELLMSPSPITIRGDTGVQGNVDTRWSNVGSSLTQYGGVSPFPWYMWNGQYTINIVNSPAIEIAVADTYYSAYAPPFEGFLASYIPIDGGGTAIGLAIHPGFPGGQTGNFDSQNALQTLLGNIFLSSRCLRRVDIKINLRHNRLRR